MKTKIKQLVKSFCLEGKITEKHAEDIEKILTEALNQQREEEKKKVLSEVVRLKSRDNVSKRTSQYTQKLDEAIAYDDGYMDGLFDLVHSLYLIQKDKE